jgi:hypothetical protein
MPASGVFIVSIKPANLLNSTGVLVCCSLKNLIESNFREAL